MTGRSADFSSSSTPRTAEDRRALSPALVRKLGWALVALLVLSVGAQWLVYVHAHFAFDAWPGFHAALGLLSGAGIVFVAWLFGVAVRRPRDYYDHGSDEGSDDGSDDHLYDRPTRPTPDVDND